MPGFLHLVRFIASGRTLIFSVYWIAEIFISENLNLFRAQRKSIVPFSPKMVYFRPQLMLESVGKKLDVESQMGGKNFLFQFDWVNTD